MILKMNKIKDQIHTFHLLIDILFFLLFIKYADIFEFLIFDIFRFI